ncbi:MAG: L-rhamnonate dehydratase [Firmicutes bacterium]|jgi:L-rhamnonate dehydratase|nr:L-rhamnonate dehydratase [Bacillota bacterium]
MKQAVKIVQLRTYTVAREGSDYHAQEAGHWIVGEIATPMSRYPEYRQSRSSWGLDVLGTVVVEVEASDGTTGFGVSTGGPLAAWIVSHHLSRFIVGQSPWNIEKMWDQMYRATLYYGRKGIVLNAISAVDLALWDLLGHIRQEPVYAMLGGAVKEEIPCYATGPRPDVAKAFGFIGGKLPLPYGPASGDEGLERNVALFRQAREQVGEEFWLMADCWMALDLPYAVELSRRLAPYHLKWIEECFPPDDFWAYQSFRKILGSQILVSTGEHEATRWGFKQLLESRAADFIQPDVSWCGGITELTKIADLADAFGVWVIPHGSSVYSYHFVMTRTNSPFAEFLMMHKDATEIVPMFSPLLAGEPVPQKGRIRLSDSPGFGVELNRSVLNPAGPLP